MSCADGSRAAERRVLPARFALGQGRTGQNASILRRMKLSLPSFLIVEDHPFQRSMLEQLLRRLGAETVHCAADGKEAIRILQDPAKRVDIVISDLMMPGVDGIELLPSLRKSARSAALVLVSAATEVLPAAEAIATAHGIKLLGTIEKPVTAANLKPLLERYVPDSSGDS